MTANGPQAEALTLARYTDPHGRPHRVAMRGRLVLDLAHREPPRVIAALGDGEGEPQARALLDGSDIDEGYLARAAREPGPFIRKLRPRDLPSAGADSQEEGGPEDEADGPPLAA